MNALERKITEAERLLTYAQKIRATEWEAEIQEHLDGLKHQQTSHTEQVTPTCVEVENMVRKFLRLEE